MNAQDPVLHVLLSADENAPSATEIVESYNFSGGGQPPLAALAAEPAQGAEYLLPRRASGAFAAYLQANPNSPRARLERYIVVRYSPSSNLTNARNALLADPSVENAHAPAAAQFAVPVATNAAMAIARLASAQSSTPWHAAINAEIGWTLASGWALVGTLDNGLATAHPSLLSFANGKFAGGNFLPAMSADAGRTGLAGCQTAGDCIDPNVDEAEPVAVPPGGNCDADGNGLATPTWAGHGTHVAGLIAAVGDSVQGVCRHCGLAPWRIVRHNCLQDGTLFAVISPAAIDAAMTFQADIGVQVINQSFVRAALTNPAHCQLNPLNSECVAIAHAVDRGVMLVAASGNNRATIGFPASQAGVVAVGGLGVGLGLWSRDTDPPPNHLDQCPQPPIVLQLGQECGSNFTLNTGADRRQELTAPAEAVRSTTYPGLDWNPGLGCGDAIGGANGDGIGDCTGTSMASPIIAGVAGLLRSINPLVLPGNPETAIDAPGIRDVLVATTHDAQNGQPWSAQLGYGRPDVEAAARRMLGTVRGQTVRNRAIPLFDFYSAAATDYAASVTPQVAMTLAVTQPWVWTARGPLVGGYPAYPIAPAAPVPLPRASAFVLSTEYKTDPKQPAIVPLFLLSRARPWPAGCVPGAFGCNAANRDFMLVSSEAHVESAVADGYDLQGRQGYIFARCTPEPSCIPTTAERLYRQCNAAEDDCAVFLENELAAFQALGYTSAHPAGSDVVMGYAYRNVDADGDALIDGFERLIGTNPNMPDSDGDGVTDGGEFPLAGVPLSDPCAGPAVTCTFDALFDNGFE